MGWARAAGPTGGDTDGAGGSERGFGPNRHTWANPPRKVRVTGLDWFPVAMVLTSGRGDATEGCMTGSPGSRSSECWMLRRRRRAVATAPVHITHECVAHGLLACQRAACRVHSESYSRRRFRIEPKSFWKSERLNSLNNRKACMSPRSSNTMRCSWSAMTSN
jgi:hypothetical protein